MWYVDAGAVCRALAGELTPVEAEGWPALALTGTVEPVKASSGEDVVRLLALFDAHLVGMVRRDDIAALLPPAHYKRVFRTYGWVSTMVLVGGRIAGSWETKAGRVAAELNVQLFEAPAAYLREGLELEAQRLRRFLSTAVSLNLRVG